MNRQMKRAQRRQGTTVDRARSASTSARRPQPEQRKRTGIRQFLKEVRQELKKVLWPTRRELVTYTIVVLVTVVVLATYVFGLDVLFSRLIVDVFA
jgi:preprotein translocase subunit SecE